MRPDLGFDGIDRGIRGDDGAALRLGLGYLEERFAQANMKRAGLAFKRIPGESIARPRNCDRMVFITGAIQRRGMRWCERIKPQMNTVYPHHELKPCAQPSRRFRELGQSECAGLWRTATPAIDILKRLMIVFPII